MSGFQLTINHLPLTIKQFHSFFSQINKILRKILTLTSSYFFQRGFRLLRHEGFLKFDRTSFLLIYFPIVK